MRLLPLRPRHAGNLVFIYAITFFGTLYFYHPIATLYYQARGLDYVEINSLWAVVVGVMAVSEVPTGLIADRIGRKWAIVLALALQLLGEIVFVVADSYPLFVLSAALGGIGFAFSSGCLESMMYDSLKLGNAAHRMQRTMGLNGAMAQLAGITGALVGGYLSQDLTMNSYVYLITMTIASVAIALAISLFLKEPRRTTDRDAPTALELLGSGVQLLRANRQLRRLVVLSILCNPLSAYLLTFYQPYLLGVGAPPSWLGPSLAAAFLLGAACSHFAYRLEAWSGVRWALLIATVLPGLLYLLMALPVAPWLAAALFVATFGTASLQKPIFSDYINRHIESGNRTTVLSMISMFSGVYVSLMGLLTGAVAEASLAATFVLTGAVVVIVSVVFRVAVAQEEGG
ncbi:MFS transporter [Pleomorphomonas sp. JP5]|uniref:MFS transporter n=1 Tax=Pleomorphomonas sp. JP5 TaxID=2942998 RepID=UPI002044B518|nr:MFS transporter [Pleomorphomonas sp. JP5]MCM5557510.1 MFS transporter [Pleomorphomonas sp. JP5]